MTFKQIAVGPMRNRAYLVVCGRTGEAAVVDPAWEPEKILAALRETGGALRYLLCTHGHDDNVNGVPEFLERFPEARAVCHERERIPAPHDRTVRVADGASLTVGDITVRCMHTPGHTPGSVTYVAGDEYAFFGDTLFAGEDCGRVDFYADGPREMFASLQKIRALPDSLIVCSGHKYGAHDTTALEYEKKHNRAIRCRSMEDFLNFKG